VVEFVFIEFVVENVVGVLRENDTIRYHFCDEKMRKVVLDFNHTKIG
jgi:hypothetical protein